MSESRSVWTTRSPTTATTGSTMEPVVLTATERDHLRRLLQELDELLAEDAGLLLELAQAREGQRRLLRIALGRLRD